MFDIFCIKIDLSELMLVMGEVIVDVIVLGVWKWFDFFVFVKVDNDNSVVVKFWVIWFLEVCEDWLIWCFEVMFYVEVCLMIGFEIVEGLYYVYEWGVFYWDVKLVNILFVDDGWLMLFDFNFGREVVFDVVKFWEILGGIFFYMLFEYFWSMMGDGDDVGVVVDVYLLGVMLF